MTSTTVTYLTKIILIEDDRAYANILKRTIESESDFKVLACFHNVEDALKASSEWQEADCALVDLELPGAPGNQLVMHLATTYPSIKIIILTAYQDTHAALQSIQCGAHGYMMKDTPLEGILRELRGLRTGGVPLDPRAAKAIMSSLRLNKETITQLSRREIEILEFINNGQQYKEIAEQLKISPHTVHSHVKRIYRRLSVSDRRAALQKAQILGIIRR